MTRGFRVRAGGRRPLRGPLRALDAATGDDRGVAAQRAGALERAALVLADFQQALAALAEVEGRMAKALEELGLAELVISIRGLSVVGAATILAETGGPTRFDDAKAVVKHAGLCPGQRLGRLCRQDHHLGSRPAAAAAGRLAGGVGRVVAQPVFAARSAHLTSRQHNRLSDTQARGAVAAALLRQLWVVCVNRSPGSWRWPAAPPGKEVTDPAA